LRLTHSVDEVFAWGAHKRRASRARTLQADTTRRVVAPGARLRRVLVPYRGDLVGAVREMQRGNDLRG